MSPVVIYKLKIKVVLVFYLIMMIILINQTQSKSKKEQLLNLKKLRKVKYWEKIIVLKPQPINLIQNMVNFIKNIQIMSILIQIAKIYLNF